MLLAGSCRKDELKGDKALLEGHWVWVQTRIYNPSSASPLLYHYPEPNLWLKIEFLKKGRITIEFNDHDHYYQETSKRITFNEFEDDGTGVYSFSLRIRHGNYFRSMSGKLIHHGADTLVVDDLPLGDTLSTVTNYYTRD
jgi:hypothetical protein